MKVLHVAAECFPFAKVGGLADVVGALPKHQNLKKQISEVIIPFYNNQIINKTKTKIIFEGNVPLNGNNYGFTIKQANANSEFTVYFVDMPQLLYTKGVYESEDEVIKFLGFQIAVLTWLLSLEKKPNIIHVHDHHAGLIPFMMSQSYQFEELKDIPSVFTIHNAQYQGWFSHERVSLIPKFDFSKVGLLDWNGSINSMAAAIKCAWKVTTVSPKYMKELQNNANGLEMLLQYEKGKCSGIINGIDEVVWNPKEDAFLIENYGITNYTTGKKRNKEYLCKKYNFNSKLPLFIFIGRLVHDKGCDLLSSMLHQKLHEWDANFLLLGSGNEDFENQLKEMNSVFNGKYFFENGYNEKLSHIMYAGADFLLMPSRVEPCGLNQLYSLKYGTLPIVNNVGGLSDTVLDVKNEEGFGFVLDELNIDNLSSAVIEAISLFANSNELKNKRKIAMKLNHSWKNSAKEYQKIYNEIK